MKEKIKIQSKQIVSVEEDSTELLDIIRKRDIKFPSAHLGFFKTVYAKIESANLNGIRLARQAVVNGISGLVGSQVNFEHLGAGFVMGTILDAWIAGDNIEVVYSMFKSVYPDEYERSVELAKEGELSVSFELLSERDTQEELKDGTIRLNDIDFVGMGHLMDNPPAEPTAKISEFAKKCKERLSHIQDRELVCASVIEQACDEVLASEHEDDEIKMPELFIVTTSDDHHFHVAEMDFDGNGVTISGHGEGKHPEPHKIVNWQIQLAKNADPETTDDGKHTHRIMNDIMAKIKEYIKVRVDKWSSDITNNFPDSSFAVIEPAFLNGETGNKKARHLPFKDRNGRFDVTNYRIALDKLDTILPVTNSITTEELRKSAKEELDKHVNEIDEPIKATKKQGGVKSMNEEEIKKVKALRDELGDFAKDVKDEDLLNDDVVAELRKEVTKATEKADSEKDDEGEAGAEGTEKTDEEKAEEIAFKTDSVEIRTFSVEEKDGVETVIEKMERMTVTDLNALKEAVAKVEELENTLEAKDSEIETVRENAEKVGQTKVQLKDNEFTKDFKDEDYLNDEKVNEAIQAQTDKETIAKRKEELKDNEYAKDFKDEDYLNEDKCELAKVKKEKDDLEATKDKVDASEEDKDDEAESDMNIGDKDDKPSEYSEVIASIRQETSKATPKQKIYTRQK